MVFLSPTRCYFYYLCPHPALICAAVWSKWRSFLFGLTHWVDQIRLMPAYSFCLAFVASVLISCYVTRLAYIFDVVPQRLILVQCIEVCNTFEIRINLVEQQRERLVHVQGIQKICFVPLSYVRNTQRSQRFNKHGGGKIVKTKLNVSLTKKNYSKRMPIPQLSF